MLRIGTAEELARKEVRTLLHEPAPFCGIGNELAALTEERLREPFLANLSGIEQCRLLIGMPKRRSAERIFRHHQEEPRVIVGILTGHNFTKMTIVVRLHTASLASPGM